MSFYFTDGVKNNVVNEIQALLDIALNHLMQRMIVLEKRLNNSNAERKIYNSTIQLLVSLFLLSEVISQKS